MRLDHLLSRELYKSHSSSNQYLVFKVQDYPCLVRFLHLDICIARDDLQVYLRQSSHLIRFISLTISLSFSILRMDPNSGKHESITNTIAE